MAASSRQITVDSEHKLQQRTEERLQSVLDAAYEAYVAIDEQGRIVDWNRQAESTFGYARDDALGRVLAELIIPPRYQSAHREGLRRFLAIGEGPVLNQRIALEARHRDGHELPVEMRIWPLRVEGGWTFHALLYDATTLRESQRQTVAAERQAAVAAGVRCGLGGW